MNLKKIILIAIVSIEIILGSFFSFRWYQNTQKQKKVLGVQKVATIDKSKTIRTDDNDLKYYWRFIPNEVRSDNPQWLGHTVKYHINNDGLNDLNDYSIEKDKNSYRIITLGDSFTYGHYVNTKNNWTEQLEILLNKKGDKCNYDNIEIINLGMPGYDVEYIVQIYKDVGEKYNPNLILWFESGSGFSRQNEFMQPIIKDCYKTASESGILEKKESFYPCWNEAQKKLEKDFGNKKTFNILQNHFDNFFTLNATKNTIFFYYNNLPKNYSSMIEIWEDKYKNAKFAPIITNERENKFVDGHPNEKGHQAIANQIYNYLETEKIICQ